MTLPKWLTICFCAAFLLPTADSLMAQQAADDASQPAASAVDENTYIIGPGDAIQVFVWRNSELSVSIPVRPDGKISTPLVADMVAVGKRPSELAKDIEGVLSEFIRSPQVSIIVTTPASALRQVQVIGEVARPSAVPYREGLRVLDVVLAVGGINQFAAGNRAKIIRTTGGKQKEIRVRLDDLTKKGDLRQNLELQPGDVIVVPESLF
jgi:polysaccharide export outer membrane protein